MTCDINLNMKNLYGKKERKVIKYLTLKCIKEQIKGNKVSFLYKDDTNEISFNKNIRFYAASTIKILVCLLVFRKVLNNELKFHSYYLIKMNELKQDTGIIKYQKQDTYYKLIDLIRLCITESDNTAYLKLTTIIGGKNVLKDFGNKLGAKYTMIGKETDSFGEINATDAYVYLSEVKKFIEENNKYSDIFKYYLLNPSTKLINNQKIENNYVRKYGSYDLAYHEIGFVNDYYLIILTQLNKKKYKRKFINKIADKIINLHDIIDNKLMK